MDETKQICSSFKDQLDQRVDDIHTNMNIEKSEECVSGSFDVVK
jgi:hypothetical protein